MKIRAEHFQVMRAAMLVVRDAGTFSPPSEYVAQSIGRVPLMRHRWDTFNAATIAGERSCSWLCRVVYPYADDTHVDTALRAIQRELWPDNAAGVSSQAGGDGTTALAGFDGGDGIG